MIRSHFLPDLRGNLNAYGRQKVRCLKCGIPTDECHLQVIASNAKAGGRGLSAHGVAGARGSCNGGSPLPYPKGLFENTSKLPNTSWIHTVSIPTRDRTWNGWQAASNPVQQRSCTTDVVDRFPLDQSVMGSRQGESSASPTPQPQAYRCVFSELFRLVLFPTGLFHAVGNECSNDGFTECKHDQE